MIETVAELIEELQKYPLNAYVERYNESYDNYYDDETEDIQGVEYKDTPYRVVIIR